MLVPQLIRGTMGSRDGGHGDKTKVFWFMRIELRAVLLNRSFRMFEFRPNYNLRQLSTLK